MNQSLMYAQRCIDQWWGLQVTVEVLGMSLMLLFDVMWKLT